MKTQLVGILNVTPDSFYDKGAYSATEHAIKRGIQIADEGADWIDIGGESTRPNATYVPVEEEHSRVIPVIQTLVQQVAIPIAIDTMKVEVAQAAIAAGASMINDVTGFSQPSMRELAAQTGVKICVMHMKGTPQTMQVSPHYENGVVEELVHWFDARIQELIQAGVKENQIILDPGIGFGKTAEDNFQILQNLSKLKIFGLPLYLGVSRKSCLGKLVGKPSADLLAATLATNLLGIMEGVEFIRVHDVKEHRDMLLCFQKFSR